MHGQTLNTHCIHIKNTDAIKYALCSHIHIQHTWHTKCLYTRHTTCTPNIHILSKIYHIYAYTYIHTHTPCIIYMYTTQSPTYVHSCCNNLKNSFIFLLFKIRHMFVPRTTWRMAKTLKRKKIQLFLWSHWF